MPDVLGKQTSPAHVCPFGQVLSPHDSRQIGFGAARAHSMRAGVAFAVMHCVSRSGTLQLRSLVHAAMHTPQMHDSEPPQVSSFSHADSQCVWLSTPGCVVLPQPHIHTHASPVMNAKRVMIYPLPSESVSVTS
jgi:hypothetical protein